MILRGAIHRTCRRFARETSGQFALITAILAIPILIGVGYSIDMTRMTHQKSALSAAIDAAALAAVMPAHLTDDERRAYAEDVFYQNYSAAAEVDLQISADREKVEIVADSAVPTLFSGILGRDFSAVREDSAAIVTREDVVCVLALDTSAAHSITFEGSARFNSPNCSVQANSSHPNALWSRVPNPPIAKSFCSTGGSQGSFFPYVKHNCSPIADPYAHLEVPPPAEGCDERENVTIIGANGRSRETVRESELQESADGEAVIPDYATLRPGIYCKGLRIDGANVKLEPGVYHIWRDLEFTQFASVEGDGVTFLLKGDGNRVLIENGARVKLRAPSEGLTKGLVFWQAHLDIRKYLRGRKTPKPPGQTAVSEINSGGGLEIIGTAYFPNHELLITSNNAVAANAPATSFIAHRLTFADRANISIDVDHVRGGIPPLQPRSDEGARLIK